MKVVCSFLDDNGFFDIEILILIKSIFEGVCDYLVLSCVYEGEFYVLFQFLQLFKQFLMVFGIECYYQIVCCFCDEDLCVDCQFEFMQIDIEMFFMSQEDIMLLVEDMMVKIMCEIKGVEFKFFFFCMMYDEVMNSYGLDKLDMCFDMFLIDVFDIVKDIEFKVFLLVVVNGGVVKVINVKGGVGDYFRKDIDVFGVFVVNYGVKGFVWVKVEVDGVKGLIVKFFDEEKQFKLIEVFDVVEGDLLLFGVDKFEVVVVLFGVLCLKFGKE